MPNFIVTARSSNRFPIDMLRHDNCWPTSPLDAARISASITQDPFLKDALDADGELRIMLTTGHRGLISHDRWRSFGWRVLNG